MSNLKFFVDANHLSQEFGELKSQVQEALTLGVQRLASMTLAKTTELANEKLQSLRGKYLENLKYEEISNGIYVVSLDSPALFIEEGRDSGDMTEDLLRKNAKVAKDGSRYKAIPFDHAKPPSQTPASSQMFVNQVKMELKARKIPYKKIEYNQDGSPRLGKLHTIKDISSLRPSARASHGALSGLNIYQQKLPNGKISRSILTFRVVSSKHKGSKWIHPGLEPKKFMDQALEWAEKKWESEIFPEIMKRFDKR